MLSREQGAQRKGHSLDRQQVRKTGEGSWVGARFISLSQISEGAEVLDFNKEHVGDSKLDGWTDSWTSQRLAR